MDVANKVARNSVITIAAESVNKILALILTIAIARYMGDYGFGRYSFVVTMMMIFQILSDFGLDGLTMREVAKNTGKTGLYLNNALFLKLVLGIISFIVLALAINLMNKPLEIVYSAYLAGLAVLFYSLANTFAAIFNAHERLDSRALLLFLSRLTVLVLSFLAITLKSGLVFFIAAILISEILRTIVGWLICEKRFAKVNFKLDLMFCRRLFFAAIPFGVIGMIALIYFKIDIVMLSLMKGDQVVGWYSAAYALLAALLFITEAYNLSIFPALSRYADSAKNLLSFGWERSVKYLLLISLPIAVGTTVLAERFIILFYSRDYEPSIIALRILIWTLPWIFVNSINMRVLYATDKQREAAIIAFISMILNVIFNFVLIPKYSYVGSSFATIAVEVINVLAYFWLVSRLLGMKVNAISILPRPLLASAVMGVVIYYLNFLNLILLILIGTVSYFTVLMMIGTFDGEDKRILRKIVPALSRMGF